MDSQNTKKHHTIISGTGRAGTTFLVQYFSALGLDTGFTLENSLSSVDSISKAGLEHSLMNTNLPEIIKAPGFSDELYNLNENISIKDAIVPVRNLYDAAESRRRVFYETNNLCHDGSLWKTNDPKKQEMHLAIQFYKLIEQLVLKKSKNTFFIFSKFCIRSRRTLE